MSATRAEPAVTAPPHPRATNTLYGHAAAEQALLAAFRSGRMPHAWLIVGPAGIGKATLAYRLARFVLAHPDPAAAAVQRAQSLAIDPAHPVARRIAAPATVIVAATREHDGQRVPWSLTWRRESRGWRLAAAGPMLE